MPREAFERSLDIPADTDRLWTTLTDVHRVASWVTVVDSVDEAEKLARYTAVLEDRLGPFSLHADLDITVTNVDIGRSITIRAEGEDRQVGSRIVVEAVLTLEPGEAATSIHVDGAYEVSGRVATLGASTIRSKATKILDEFFMEAERELAS